MEIYKIKQKPNKTTAASLLVLEIYKNLSFLLRAKGVQFGCTAERTERVQVTYLKVKKGNKTNLCMKGCRNSVVDTSGHKHRECIIWTKSIITIRAKIVDQQAIFDTARVNSFIGLIWWPASTAVKSRTNSFQVVSHTKWTFSSHCGS